MSVQSQLKFPLRKRITVGKQSENLPPKSGCVKRALFGEAQLAPSPKKARIADENISFNEKSSPKKVSPLMKIKQVLHTSLPSRLIGRSKEIADLHDFISERINNKTSGSLYISGAPGTGKTCSLMHILRNFENKFSFVFVNCMSVSSPAAIYKTIGKELGLSSKIIKSKTIADILKKHVTTSKNPIVLVLDEIEQLDCKDQHVLYDLFEWPHLPQSKLILVTISNAMDLTDRILPRLHTFKFQPQLMNFRPYTKDEIVSILEDRLSEVQSNGKLVIKPIAVQLCARKIAADSGDIRKALNVCMRAVQVVEKKFAKEVTLRSTSDDRCNPGSPMKNVAQIPCVDVQEISSVLHEVYGSRLQTSSFATNQGTVTMPLHSMILLCTVVLMKKHCKQQEMTTGKAYSVYKKVCLKRKITNVNESEFHRLISDLECRGFLLLKSAKEPRLTKFLLKVDENEAEHVMQDKALLPSILSDRSVLSK
ncbi:cell division control protein 6 homolog [Caerostris extrusa]|uniref:Cell division control protein n=1 Tax=Caerostris extrusa TaxID=172846 RepID=A0AAV4RU95_CAEEX|nr:cell division control protein 6 homolog [Caerostris extrusa]